MPSRTVNATGELDPRRSTSSDSRTSQGGTEPAVSRYSGERAGRSERRSTPHSERRSGGAHINESIGNTSGSVLCSGGITRTTACPETTRRCAHSTTKSSTAGTSAYSAVAKGLDGPRKSAPTFANGDLSPNRQSPIRGPNDALHAADRRWEPCAGNPLAGLCPGGPRKRVPTGTGRRRR